MDIPTVFTITFVCFVTCGLCQELDQDDLVTPTVVIGEECKDIILTCQLTGAGLTLSSHRMFSWSKRGGAPPSDGGLISINDCNFNDVGELLYPDKYNYTVANDNTGCNLTIKAARLSDSGCYQCDSWGPSGAVSSYVEVTVIDAVRRVSLKQTSPWVLENIPTTFTCSAGYGDGEVQTFWFLDGNIVRVPDRTEINAIRTGEGVDCTGRNETIFAVDLALARDRKGSVLECVIHGDGLLEMRANVTISDILVPPTSVLVGLFDKITSELHNTTGDEILIEEHSNASFGCLVEDTLPAANVTWFFRGYKVLTGTGGSTEAVTRLRGNGTTDVISTVVLPDVVWPDDGKELVCRATGAGGISVSSGIRIIVDGPPQNVSLSTDVIVERVTTVFVCTTGQTRTASSMVWYLNGINVTDTGSQKTSYSPEHLETTSIISLSLRRDQTGSRLTCEVHHELLKNPLVREEILDVHFCSSPSLSCPAVTNTSESNTLTCSTPSSRPPANLSMYIDVPFRQLSTDYGARYEPAEHGGMMALMTVELYGDRRDHGRTVVCRRKSNEICIDEELDKCQLNVHFPPNEVKLSDGSSTNGNSDIGKRIVDVFDGREYSFTCAASGSNPAATFRWRLGTDEVGGAVYTKTERPYGGWNASSRLSLAVKQDTHHAQKLTCEIRYPSSQEVFQQLSLEFSVIAVTNSWTMIIVIIACSSAVVLVAVVCLLVILCKICHRGNQRFSVETDMELKQLNSQFEKAGSKSSLSSRGTVRSSLDGRSEAHDFPRENLRLQEIVGSGAYGLVYKATAMGIYEKGTESTVAVKTPNPSGSPADRDDFLKELEMFTILVQHPNVVSMLGYCRKKDPVYLIMEYVPNGNLENYLRLEKQRMDRSYTNINGTFEAIDPTQILTFACQIVRGMKYLASVQCIHRDLATRNILLDENMVCKVSDFGLARHVPVQKQYEMKSQTRVPFRWMAPESILCNVYTTKSDVWSFGVLLWELVTLGSHPYPGLSCTEILEDLQKGVRLQKPAHCSDDIYQLMKDCWEGRSEARPDFEMLYMRIEEMLANASGYLMMSNFSTEQYVYMAPGSN